MTEQLEDWNLEDEKKQKILNHPCMKCDVPIYQKFPHPIFRCDKDGHEEIMIIDLLQMLEHLYAKCPLKEGG
jgi:hypothetical protein